MTKALQALDGGVAFPPRVRALFISDVHLGTRSAQAGPLLDFLKHCEADTIYLVGDIVDFLEGTTGPALAAGPQRRGAEAAAPGS